MEQQSPQISSKPSEKSPLNKLVKIALIGGAIFLFIIILLIVFFFRLIAGIFTNIREGAQTVRSSGVVTNIKPEDERKTEKISGIVSHINADENWIDMKVGENLTRVMFPTKTIFDELAPKDSDNQTKQTLEEGDTLSVEGYYENATTFIVTSANAISQ